MSRKILDAAIVLLAAALFLIIALGGIDYDWGILRIRLHSVSRAAILLGALLAARVWVTGINAIYIATRGLMALLLATAAVYATYHVRVCGGLDSYGYVSTSSLIVSGRLIQPQPLAALLPFPGASDAAAPLGYVAGPGSYTQVPRFPLGLPLVMALFRIFGDMGPFYVPLLMAYVTIALAFLLVRDTNNAGLQSDPGHDLNLVVALFAAVLVAIDPPLVDYGIQPMSDVPAACWLLAALSLRLRRGPRRTRVFSDPAIWGGVCAGMAFLTRPALLVAVVAVGAVTLDRPIRETIRFGLTFLAFVLVQMLINRELYGSVRMSGYGPASYMFEISWVRFAANARNFARSLTYSHTAAVWFLWPGALFVLRRQKWAWQLSAVAASAALPYLFYLVFEGWETLRFLLPTIVLVLILAAKAIGEVPARLAQLKLRPTDTFAQLKLRPTGVSVWAIMLFLIAIGCAAASHRFLQREGVYGFGAMEAKYALAGQWIETHTPERAVVFAGLHSGSLQYYGHRQTIRWDQIPPDKMSATLHNLTAAGFELYAALDAASEPPLFDERFRMDSAVRIEQIGRVRVVNFYRFVSAP